MQPNQTPSDVEDVGTLLVQAEKCATNYDLDGLQSVLNVVHEWYTTRPDRESDYVGVLRSVIDIFIAEIESKNNGSVELLRSARDQFAAIGQHHSAAVLSLSIAEREYRQSNLTTALEGYRAAVDFFTHVSDIGYLARAKENMGLAMLRLGQLDEAVTWFTEAMMCLEQTGDELALIKLKANFGILHVERGDTQTALNYYLEALTGYETNKNFRLVGQIAANVGFCYAELANYPLAFEYLNKAISNSRDANDLRSLAVSTSVLGEVFLACADYERALHWFEESLKHSLAIGNMSAVSTKRLLLGVTYLQLERTTDAAFQLETAFALASEQANNRAINKVSAYLALVRLRQGRLAEASERITEAIHVAQSSGLGRDLMSFYIIEARIALAQNHLAKCKNAVQEVIALAEQMKTEKELSDALHLLYQVERAQDHVLPALEALEQYQLIHARILGEQKQRQMALLDAEQKISVQAYEHKRTLAEERKLRNQQRILLTNMLPEEIAERLMNGEPQVADRFAEVSVMFLDLVNFTELASHIPPEHVLHVLNKIFGTCDEIVKKHGVTKIKTIGDAYMAVAGAPVVSHDNVKRMAMAALEIRKALTDLLIEPPNDRQDVSWAKGLTDQEVRIGIHCGPASAGIIGNVRMAYDVWGDTVNVGARMEQTGLPGLIQVTEHFRQRLLETAPDVATFSKRGPVEIKGRGVMETWWMHMPNP